MGFSHVEVGFWDLNMEFWILGMDLDIDDVAIRGERISHDFEREC